MIDIKILALQIQALKSNMDWINASTFYMPATTFDIALKNAEDQLEILKKWRAIQLGNISN
jgi:hypothetical protein